MTRRRPLALLAFAAAACQGCSALLAAAPRLQGLANAPRCPWTASCSAFMGRQMASVAGPSRTCAFSSPRRSLGMFFGPQESFFGIGAPEFALVLAVGYFFLGPTELYKLTKQIGTMVGQFREFGVGTVTNFQQVMDKQLAEVENVAAGRKSSLDSLWGNKEDDEDDDEEFEEIYEDGEEEDVAEAPLDDTWGFRANKPKPEDETDTIPAAGVAAARSMSVEAAVAAAAAPAATMSAGKAGAPQASRFASQLSGQWNDQIMAQGEHDAAESDASDDDGVEEEVRNSLWGGDGTGDVPDELSAADAEGTEMAALTMDEQFARLEQIAALEDERAAVMQRLEAELDKKLRTVRKELLQIDDEDYA
ncbi:unnamed protein product, partial [Phaeothamnion confervicola]